MQTNSPEAEATHHLPPPTSHYPSAPPAVSGSGSKLTRTLLAIVVALLIMATIEATFMIWMMVHW